MSLQSVELIYAMQSGVVWTITAGVDLTTADTVMLKMKPNVRDHPAEGTFGAYKELIATGTSTGCTFTTDANTFPFRGEWFFQVVAEFSSPTKVLTSSVERVEVRASL